MKIDGYSQVDVSVGVPASLLEARERGIQKEGEQFLQQLRADAVFEQIARDRKELARLRERVAGLLERNTSLVHTKRDLEAQVKALEEYNAHYRGAHGEAQLTIERLHNEIRCLKDRVPYTTPKTRDIPIREIPIIHSRRDAN